MKNWLFKTEPGDYNFENLLAEGTTIWDGITNNWALKNLKEARAGDRVLIYHTGKEKKVAGLAEITRSPYPDPAQSDAKLIVVDIKPLVKLQGEISLAKLKADPKFSDFMLVKFSRLSVIPVEDKHWKEFEKIEPELTKF